MRPRVVMMAGVCAGVVGVGAGLASAQVGLTPHVGYAFPAGAKQGTRLHVIVAGQQLRQVRDVLISGDGVHATVIHFVPLGRRLEREQVPEARARLLTLREYPRADSARMEPDLERGVRTAQAPKAKQAPTPKGEAGVNEKEKQAKNASGIDVQKLSLRELELVMAMVRTFDKRQMNAQLAEAVLLEIEVDPGAKAGDRELRLYGPSGLSNPIPFEVGTLPEVFEQEPVGRDGAEPPAAVAIPCTINGQIMPGDRDRFTFHARRGQHVVVDVQARRLVPYLADAVPGWFEPTIKVSAADGRELAFADDFGVSPDPVLQCQIPGDGDYGLEISDALYRGREDFVYRVTIGELPYVTGIYPLGAKGGEQATATLYGWNLGVKEAKLDTSGDGPARRELQITRARRACNGAAYEVGDLPEVTEPKQGGVQAPLTLPVVVNGRIARPGAVDDFAFEGRKGQEVVLEVTARRLGSRLDSRLTLLDKDGDVVASNDDMDEPGYGLLTYNADSYVRATLPADGVYHGVIADAAGKGGEDFGYRLRISGPRPGFEVRVTPSSVNVGAGRCAVMTAHVLRRDGYEGEVQLSLAGAPEGFALQGATIPGGQRSVRFTISGPQEPMARPVELGMEARPGRGGPAVVERVIPAEDMMQAFLYRHLVPSQALMAQVIGPRVSSEPMSAAGDLPVRLVPGARATVRVRVPSGVWTQGVELELDDPPKGITLVGTEVQRGVASLIIGVDEKAQPLRDNLIVGVYRTPSGNARAGVQKLGRVQVGYLPALPIEVVKP